MTRNQKRIADMLAAKVTELQAAERKLEELHELRDRELSQMREYYEGLLIRNAGASQQSE
jgi:hypothetical protein